MPGELRCYRCGAPLASLTLPWSRRDECPGCANYLHVCRMCIHFDRNVPKQCREDDAEEVLEKERLNFCDWFSPASGAFDARGQREEARARSELGALFGEDEAEKPAADDLLRRAEDLFK